MAARRWIALVALGLTASLTSCTAQPAEWSDTFQESVVDIVWDEGGPYVVTEAPGGSAINRLSVTDGRVEWSQYLADARPLVVQVVPGGIIVNAGQGVDEPDLIVEYDGAGRVTNRFQVIGGTVEVLTEDGRLVQVLDDGLVIVSGPIITDADRWPIADGCDITGVDATGSAVLVESVCDGSAFVDLLSQDGLGTLERWEFGRNDSVAITADPDHIAILSDGLIRIYDEGGNPIATTPGTSGTLCTFAAVIGVKTMEALTVIDAASGLALWRLPHEDWDDLACLTEHIVTSDADDALPFGSTVAARNVLSGVVDGVAWLPERVTRITGGADDVLVAGSEFARLLPDLDDSSPPEPIEMPLTVGDIERLAGIDGYTLLDAEASALDDARGVARESFVPPTPTGPFVRVTLVRLGRGLPESVLDAIPEAQDMGPIEGLAPTAHYVKDLGAEDERRQIVLSQVGDVIVVVDVRGDDPSLAATIAQLALDRLGEAGRG